MAGEKLHPSAFLQAYRETYPKKFDDLSDHALLDAIKELDPEAYGMVDEMLLGTEILDQAQRGRSTPRPVALPTPPAMPTKTDMVITGGLRAVPAIGGTILGGVLGGMGGAATGPAAPAATPAGVVKGGAIGGAIGSGLGEVLAETYESSLGLPDATGKPREGLNPLTIGLETGLGAINPALKGATAAARVGRQAAFGAGLAGGGTIGRSLIEAQQLPSAEELLLNTAVGVVAGATIQGSAEGLQALRARRSGAPATLPQAQEAKSYLEDIAAAQTLQKGSADLNQRMLEASRFGPPPPPPPAQRMLPPGSGTRQLPDGSAPFIGPPPGREMVGGGVPPGRMLESASSEVYPPAPPAPVTPQVLGGAIEQSLQAPPGQPQLVLRGERLSLSRATPRQGQLLPPPRADFNTPIRQNNLVGGADPSIDQPRLPHVLEGEPLRPYAKGPNAGPRRPLHQELHGKPRQVQRFIDVAGKRKSEWAPSKLLAEDPGTYPPEVRRELARMLYELETQTHSRYSMDATSRRNLYKEGVTPEDMRRSGASEWGAVPGAPVYHEILQEAINGGSFNKHVTRAQVAQHIRQALLEGRGTGLTDAAAQIARKRMAQEAAGGGKGKTWKDRQGVTRRLGYAITSNPGDGDHLIGWVDDAGRAALPDVELDPLVREVRELSDGELLDAFRMRRDLPDLAEESIPWFDAAAEEAARRGIVDPQQGELVMLGPGADKGPSLFDFDGGPPAKPTQPTAPSATVRLYRGGPAYDAAYAAAHPTAGRTPRNAGQWFTTSLQKARGYGEGELQYLDVPRDVLEATRAPGAVDEHLLPELWAARAQQMQESLPGLESVRSTETPTPELEVPFSLTAPPTKPDRMKPTGSLFGELERFLKGDEGTVLLPRLPPANDRKRLKAWIKSIPASQREETWFHRVEQAMDAGDFDRAWQVAMAASHRKALDAYKAAKTPQARQQLQAALRGTILQDDMTSQLIAQTRQEAGIGTAPPVKDVAPSRRVPQAGAARGDASLGPGGVLNPGPPKRPLSSAQPSIRSGGMDPNVVKLILDATSAEGKAVVPGNQDTMNRIFRQVGEDVYFNENLALLREAGMDLPAEEVAQHFVSTVSGWGRGLNLLSQFVQANKEELTEAAEAMSMGGALRGMLGRRRSTPRYGARNIPLSQPTREVIQEIEKESRTFNQNMVNNTLQKRRPVGVLQAVHDASYTYMLMRWATAVRDFASTSARFTTEALDHALTIPAAGLLGDANQIKLAQATLRERGVTPVKRGAFVSPRRGTRETIQEIWDLTADSLAGAKPTDVRHALKLLTEMPDAAADFLGSLGGENLRMVSAELPVLRHLTNPKVQRVLSAFRHASEFTSRASVYGSTLRSLLRAQGIDPAILTRPTPEIIDAVGGQAAFGNLVQTSITQALESSFSGGLAKDSLPGSIVRAFNMVWPAKLAVPFPRFNFSAAPRWIYDHGPWALADLLRLPFDQAGITAPQGTYAGGRLTRGMRAQHLQEVTLPQTLLKQTEAETRSAELLSQLAATQKEIRVQTARVKAIEKNATSGSLTAPSNLEAAQQALAQLTASRDQLKLDFNTQYTLSKELKATAEKHLSTINDALNINAPTMAQFMGRMGTGTTLLMAAMAVRAQEGAEGTRWYEFRVDGEEGEDPTILDFRPAAPFVQYLYVADVLLDFERWTNWQGVKTSLEEQGYDWKTNTAVGAGSGAAIGGALAGPPGAAAGAVMGAGLTNLNAWTRAIWENYEGKYTEEELGTQFAQAFFSISRAAGTTLTLTDLATQNGWPNVEEFSKALVGTVGQFLNRWVTGLTQISDVVGAFDPEESSVRTPPRATTQNPERPLAAPIASVPFARRLVPEVISQTSGKPLGTQHPLMRSLLGIGSSPRDFVVEEVRRVGVPGQSVYIGETGDVERDRLVAEIYPQNLQRYLPEILSSQEYAQLRTPARQRDFLQQVFSEIKQETMAEVRGYLGEERWAESEPRGEDFRRRLRQQRMEEEMAQSEGLAPPPGPPDSAEASPGMPPPPAPAAAGSAFPPPPMFAP